MESNYNNIHDVLAELQKHSVKKILFLGNGFSTGFKNSGYRILKETICQKLDKNSSLYRQLTNSDKSNIERFLLEYDYGFVSIPQLYEEYIKGIDKEETSRILISLKNDRKKLWNAFFDAFSCNHPTSLSYSDLEKINNAAFNITTPFSFNQIITTNYDLVLYWVIQEANQILNKSHFKDAFSNPPMPGIVEEGILEKLPEKIKNNILFFRIKNNKINVFFLHGAIHIFDIGPYTFKLKKDQNSVPLRLGTVIEQFKEILKIEDLSNFFKSTTVLEGSTEFKEKYISDSLYLSDIYNRFDSIEGDLVIYGCNIIEHSGGFNNDLHIWRRIFKRNKLNNIYIGLHEENRHYIDKKSQVIDRIKKIRGTDSVPENVFFFPTKNTLSIWERPN